VSFPKFFSTDHLTIIRQTNSVHHLKTKQISASNPLLYAKAYDKLSNSKIGALMKYELFQSIYDGQALRNMVEKPP